MVARRAGQTPRTSPGRRPDHRAPGKKADSRKKTLTPRAQSRTISPEKAEVVPPKKVESPLSPGDSHVTATSAFPFFVFTQ